MYVEDSRRFVRCIEFILTKYNMKSVRFHLCDNQYSTCPTMAGTLVSDNDAKKEYDSMSDWYNDVMNTNYDVTTTSYFANIYISKQVNLEFVVTKMATMEDIGEFTDHKYRSYMLYKKINAMLRTLNYIRAWNSYSLYKVAWNGTEYTVRINNVSTVGSPDTSDMMLSQFIQGTITDLYYVTPTERIPIPNISPDIRSQRRIRTKREKASAPVATTVVTEQVVEPAAAVATAEIAEPVMEPIVQSNPEPNPQYVMFDMEILVQHLNASGKFVDIDTHNTLKSSFEIAMQEIHILKEQIKNLQAHVNAQGRYLAMTSQQQQQQQQQYYAHQPLMQPLHPFLAVPQNYTKQ
jgi:hypothetical protein